MKKLLHLLASPAESAAASASGFYTAHRAYHIGPDRHLYRQNSLPAGVRGGVMAITSVPAQNGNNSNIMTEVMREVGARGYSGIYLELAATEAAPRELILELENRLLSENLMLYLPEKHDSGYERLCVVSGMTGEGSMAEIIQSHVHRRGVGRAAMLLEPRRLDYSLNSDAPASALDRSQLAQLINNLKPSVYFSDSLCAHYFTYNDSNGPHFVVYDDAGTLNKMLSAASSAGITAVFAEYNVISSMLPGIQLS